MWAPLRPPRFGEAIHANGHHNRSRHRQVSRIPNARPSSLIAGAPSSRSNGIIVSRSGRMPRILASDYHSKSYRVYGGEIGDPELDKVVLQCFTLAIAGAGGTLRRLMLSSPRS